MKQHTFRRVNITILESYLARSNKFNEHEKLKLIKRKCSVCGMTKYECSNLPPLYIHKDGTAINTRHIPECI